MGRSGAPGAPTFKQVIIDKGKKLAEGTKIQGSSVTCNHTGHTEILSDILTTETVKGSTSKEGICLDQPSQEADPRGRAADLSDNDNQNAHLGRSENSGGNRAQPKLQG